MTICGYSDSLEVWHGMCKRRSACRRSIILFFSRCGSLPLHSSTAQQQRHGSLEIWDPGMIRAWHDPCQNKIILEISEPGMECARKKACHVGYYHMVIWKFRAWGGIFFCYLGESMPDIPQHSLQKPIPVDSLKVYSARAVSFPMPDSTIAAPTLCARSRAR